MGKFSDFVKTLATAAIPAMAATAAEPATVNGDTATLAQIAGGLTTGQNLIDTIDPAVAGKTVLGQSRYIGPRGDHPEARTQVYVVREDFKLACSTPSGPVSVKAYTADVYDQIIKAGSLDVLTDGTVQSAQEVELDTLKFNGPYMYNLEGGGFDLLRTQVGAHIANASISVDGQLINVNDAIEPSDYTVKLENSAAFNDVNDAYMSGKPVTVVAQTERGHTMVYTYQIEADVKQDFEACLDDGKKSAPFNEYFSITTTPLPNASRAQIEGVLGEQCLKGKVDPAQVDLESIEGGSGGYIPFSKALRDKITGELFVSDYLKVDKNGNAYLSASLQQGLQTSFVNSCSGTTAMPKPPVYSFTPQVPSTPIYPIPVTPVVYPVIIPPGGGGGGCIKDCGGVTPPPPPPPPPPVPIGSTLPLILTGIGALAALRRREPKGP